MKKYRKRPVMVEAIQFTGDNREEVEKFLQGTPHVWGDQCAENFLTIVTLEGNHHVSVGDYIIKGVKGEFYPCKPDIFEMTYELVTETEGGDGEPAKKGLPATEEYDRVRRADAWAGVYTDGTPVRLLPQTVSDAMRDELLDRVKDLEAALVRAKFQSYNELRHRADEAEEALDTIAAMLGIDASRGTVNLAEVRRRIGSLQYCSTCAHWSAEDNQCAADPMDSRSWYCSTYSYCRYTPSRWQPR